MVLHDAGQKMWSQRKEGGRETEAATVTGEWSAGLQFYSGSFLPTACMTTSAGNLQPR